MSDEQCEDVCEEELAASLPMPDVPGCREPWTTQELLTLVSAVARHGDTNWAVIERAFKLFPLDTNLSHERYTPENCAEQYARLTKLLDDAEMAFEDVEKQATYLESKMSEIHLQELQYSIQQTFNIFGQALSFYEQVESGEFDEEGELTLDAINELDEEYDTMYEQWLSHCNEGRTVGPRVNPMARSGERFVIPPEYFEMDKDDEEGASTSGYSPSGFEQTEVTSEYLAEQIELAKAACALEMQGTGAETTVSTATKTEPSLQPFFNPTNLLKSASAGLFPFATVSAEGAIQINPGLGSPQKSAASTVSSVTQSAPTLSKLLELPPSIPGKLPPLPTFHLKPEPPDSSKSSHKTLVQQLEATIPPKQTKGFELPAEASSAGTVSVQEGTFESSVRDSLTAYIKKELLEPEEPEEETAIMSKSLIKMNDAFYSVSEISSCQQLGNNSQEQGDEGSIRELSTENKSTLDENASSSREEIMDFDQNIAQAKDSHPKTEASNKIIVEVAGTSVEIKQEVIEEFQSSKHTEEGDVSETQGIFRSDKSSTLLESALSANREISTQQRKETNKGLEPSTKSTTSALDSVSAPGTSVPPTSSTSKNTASESCEFSFEEINFPIPKTTNESACSSETSKLRHKTSLKRKRDSIEHVSSFATPGSSGNLRKDTAEAVTRPQKISKTGPTPFGTETPDRIVPPNHEPEILEEKNKDADHKSHIDSQIYDQSVGSEVQATDKNRDSQSQEELSSKPESSDNSSSSQTPEIKHIKEEVLEADENEQSNICIRDLTIDQSQEKTRKLSEVSSSLSVQSSSSEDAAGNITRQTDSPSTYQVSKSVANLKSTPSIQDSVELNVPEVAISKEIKQEPPDSESESDTFSSGNPTFTSFSCVSSPGSIGEGEQKKSRTGGIVPKAENATPSGKSTPNENEEKKLQSSGRRASKKLLAFVQETRMSSFGDVWNQSGRRRGKTHVKEPSDKDPQDQSSINTVKETSCTESLSVNKKHSGGSIAQVEAEKLSSKGTPGPVRRGRPRRSKPPERNSKDNEKEVSNADDDFGNSKKSQQTTVKHEKKDMRKSRKSSVSAERDIGEDESTTSSQDSEKDFSFRGRRNVRKGSDSRDKRDIEELSEKKISELSDDGENSCLKNILTGTKSSSPENTSVSGSSSAKGKGGKGRWSPQSVDPTSQSTVATPITSDISDDSSDESDTSASTSTKRSKLKWINRDSQQKYKTWKKSISIVWREAANHKYANVFSQKVTNDVAPGYDGVVHRPMDLSTIKKNIESGAIKTTDEFQRDMMLMFSNAIMYNSSDHDVYHMAVEMQRDVQKQIKDYLATQAIVQNKNKDPPVSNLRAVRQAKAQRSSTPKGN